MPVDVERLADLPLFEGLTSIELEEIGAQLETSTAAAGTAIIREGDPPGHPIYLLLRGSVDVLKTGLDRRSHLISSLAAPSVFGEIEVLARRPAIAGVVAATEVGYAALRRGVFDEMIAANRPCILKVVKNVAQVLSYRLAATDERMAAYFSFSQPGGQELNSMRSVLYSSWQAD